MSSTPVYTVNPAHSIVTVSSIRRTVQARSQVQSDPCLIQDLSQSQHSHFTGHVTQFLRSDKGSDYHSAIQTLWRRKSAQRKKIAKARVERERQRLQINSRAFNTKAWWKRRKVTTKEKSLQLDHDHFLLNPSQPPLKGERILKWEQISVFYFMIEVPLPPRTLPFVMYHA